MLDASDTHDQIPPNVARRFSDARSLLTLIESGSRGETANLEEIWASNWRENYSSFIKGVIG